MKIGILGSGNVGQALAKGYLAEGHEVFLATRDPASEKADQLRTSMDGVYVCSFVDTAKQAELAVLCTPWAAAADALKLAEAEATLAGKVLIDTNNALNRGSDGVELVLDIGGSAGETVQSWLPNTKVVKCWNTVGAVNMYKPDFGGLQPTMFLCGDDKDAKATVSELVVAFGWEPFNAGGIKASRQLEPIAVLWINNSMRSGEPHHALKML